METPTIYLEMAEAIRMIFFVMIGNKIFRHLKIPISDRTGGP